MITEDLADYFVVKTLMGLEDVLAKECETQNLGPVKKGVRAVIIPNNRESLIRANMSLRTALRILIPLYSFDYSSEEEFYERCLHYVWSQFIRPDDSFKIQVSGQSLVAKHSGYLALKLKDALCDQIKSQKGFRPTVDKISPKWTIDVHLSGNKVDISLDSSGQPLFKRGWRSKHGKASVNEVLAAGIIFLTGWDSEKEDFYDLMCGSGTFLAEAAAIAANYAPGLYGRAYNFFAFPGFDQRTYQKVRRSLASQKKEINVKIWGSDNDPVAIAHAHHNLARAGFSKEVFIQKMDIRKPSLNPSSGLILLNPPYEKRILTKNPDELYASIGRFLKKNCSGARAAVFSGNFDALKRIGLKPTQSISLLNGAMPCKLVLYELFKGKRKNYLQLKHEKRAL